jgi:hypothetical protein
MKLKIQIFDKKIDISESPVIQLLIDDKPALIAYSVIKADGVVTINISAGFRNKARKRK